VSNHRSRDKIAPFYLVNNMKITFKYDLEKEYTNLWCGLGSLNRPDELPKLAQEIVDLGIELHDKEKIMKFFNDKMEAKNIDIKQKLRELKSGWLSIAGEAENRLKKLFNTDIDLGDVTAYLTVSRRCGYNPKERLFFVSVNRDEPNSTIIHEILHFYTHNLYEQKFLDAGLSYEDFNDYKEALTFILNTDFHDLLGGEIDKGYEKQKDLRIWLENKWPSCKNIGELTKMAMEKLSH